MPHLNIDVLVRQLEKTAHNIYQMYVDEKDFGISERLLAEHDRITYLIQQLNLISGPSS